ncbi:MAG: hypothetical protein V2I33_14540, partial [Kangiellaceae bacterium]|nr:hypothetical protein [Kangiellaceae bacterium]
MTLTHRLNLILLPTIIVLVSVVVLVSYEQSLKLKIDQINDALSIEFNSTQLELEHELELFERSNRSLAANLGRFYRLKPNARNKALADYLNANSYYSDDADAASDIIQVFDQDFELESSSNFAGKFAKVSRIPFTNSRRIELAKLAAQSSARYQQLTTNMISSEGNDYLLYSVYVVRYNSRSNNELKTKILVRAINYSGFGQRLSNLRTNYAANVTLSFREEINQTLAGGANSLTIKMLQDELNDIALQLENKLFQIDITIPDTQVLGELPITLQELLTFAVLTIVIVYFILVIILNNQIVSPVRSLLTQVRNTELGEHV